MRPAEDCRRECELPRTDCRFAGDGDALGAPRLRSRALGATSPENVPAVSSVLPVRSVPGTRKTSSEAVSVLSLDRCGRTSGQRACRWGRRRGCSPTSEASYSKGVVSADVGWCSRTSRKECRDYRCRSRPSPIPRRGSAFCSGICEEVAVERSMNSSGADQGEGALALPEGRGWLSRGWWTASSSVNGLP